MDSSMGEHTKKAGNIGGSILPSSSPHTLRETEHPFCRLQVKELREADTHGLFCDSGAGWSLIATHPNSFSLRELADRMASGIPDRVLEQADYILACGGTMIIPSRVVGVMAR